MSENKHEQMMATNYSGIQAGPHSRLLKSDQYSEEDFFIDAYWLKQQIDNNIPNLVILDVTRGQGEYKLDETRVDSDYKKGHIPGSISFSTDKIGEFKDYLKKPELLKDVFLEHGVSKDTLLVVYSIYSRDIIYIASRIAFSAYYLGVDQVKILDGGLQAWERSGYDLETGINLPNPKSNFGSSVPRRQDLLIREPQDLMDYKKAHPDAVLASVRTWKEYTGQNEGHAWNKGVGEIAGAVYAGDELLANQNGEIADPEVYLNSWKQWGIEEDRDIIFYCGTGWRSSTAFFVAKHLGWPNVRMFDGSWYKYYRAHKKQPKKYPIQIGNPKSKKGVRIINRC